MFWKKNLGQIFTGAGLLIIVCVIIWPEIIWPEMNISPTTTAERAQLDSLIAILNTAQPTALIEDIFGHIEVISEINLKDQKICIWSSKAHHNELWRFKIRDCAKKMRRLYNPGDADYYKAADRLISQISAIKQTL